MKAGSGFPRFSGSFKTFRVTVQTNREKGTQDNLVVYSSGSRPAVLKFLWYKFLWDELTKEEWKLFIILPESLNNPMIFGALRALQIKGKKEIRRKILNAPFLSYEERPLRTKYQGIKGLSIEIHEESRKLPKVPKFSGWIRSASSVGSKRQRGPSFLEPLAIIENDYNDFSFDWYSYLTVGDSYLQTGRKTLSS